MAKYNGELSDLKEVLEAHGITGTWQEVETGTKFTAKTGGHITLFHNGTLLVQGNDQAKEKLNAFIATLEKSPVPKTTISVPGVENKTLQENPQIFVVYGHDHQSREQLEYILLKVGIEPFVLGNTAGGGLTIIEALEKQVGVNGTAKAGIVLLTPDDIGYAKNNGPENAQPRARQNVVLEMGMLLGKLGRTNTTIIIKGHLEEPSDIKGIIYLHYNDHVKEIASRLFERLAEAGIEIEDKLILKALK